MLLKVKNNTENTRKQVIFDLKKSEFDQFEMEVENISDGEGLSFYPASLFQEMKQEVSQKLFNTENGDDSTDGPLNFIENLVNNLQTEFDKTLGENVDKRLFVRSLTKIFTILLSVKADSTEKIKQMIKIAINAFLKLWSGQN